jgi:hypothetical protein
MSNLVSDLFLSEITTEMHPRRKIADHHHLRGSYVVDRKGTNN